jgi:hypothetical protein
MCDSVPRGAVDGVCWLSALFPRAAARRFGKPGRLERAPGGVFLLPELKTEILTTVQFQEELRRAARLDGRCAVENPLAAAVLHQAQATAAN